MPVPRSPYDYSGIGPIPAPPATPPMVWPNNEAIDDRVANLLVAGDNVTLDYDDDAGTLTINAAGGPETTISTLPPDDLQGEDGDIWFQVPA